MTPRATTSSTTAFDLDDIADLLGQTIGLMQARALVEDTAMSLGLRGSALQPNEAEAVLGRLAAMPGFVGIAAQMARTRLRLAALQKNLQRSGT